MPRVVIRVPRQSSELGDASRFLRRIYWIVLVVNLSALALDITILSGVKLPAITIVPLVFIPPVLFVCATLLASTDRRNWASVQRLSTGLLDLRTSS